MVLNNASSLPKTVTGHNWLLLTKGTDPLALANAAIPEAANGYISAKPKDEIIAFIGLLGPSKSGETTFQAPSEPGEYTFLCTVPGHCQTGMKGTLVVQKRPN